MQRDINLFSVYHSSGDTDGMDRITLVGLAVVALCLIGVLGGYIGLKVQDGSLKAQISSATAYLRRGDISSAVSKLVEGNKKEAALKSYAKTASSQTAAFSSLPQPDSAVINNIKKAMTPDVALTAVTYSSGTYTLTCTAAYELSAAAFVHTLKTQGGFSSVSYSGVLLSGVSYTFTVECTATGGNGK